MPKSPEERYKFRDELLRAPKKKLNYKVIITANGKQCNFIGSYETEESAKRKVRELVTDLQNINFPVRYINSGKIHECEYEIVILKKNTENNSEEKTYLRDSYGMLVPHTVTNTNKWSLIHKEHYEKEETFWVFGFDPFYDRKDFNYVLDEMICKNTHSAATMKQLVVLNNKLLILEGENLELVICKNKADAIRLYNEIEKQVKEIRKVRKYVMFSGFVSKLMRKRIVEKIAEKTGWNYTKINRVSTRP